jgi:hypothetical protein
LWDPIGWHPGEEAGAVRERDGPPVQPRQALLDELRQIPCGDQRAEVIAIVRHRDGVEGHRFDP